MKRSSKTDPFGHVLLEARIRSIPNLVESYLQEEAPEISDDVKSCKDFIVTGVGSSWGHALYLSQLLRDYCRCESRSVPLSGFLRRAIVRDYSNSVLIICSQGFSDNVQLALQHADRFRKVVLLTAATPESLEDLGKTARAQQLRELRDRGANIIEFPLTSEYTLLIRVVGPLMGYLACLRFLQSIPDNELPTLNQEYLLSQLKRENVDSILDLFDDERARSPLIVAGYPLSFFASNLSYKFLEGIFTPGLGICDLLEFSHGPFQQLVANPRPVLVLETPDWDPEIKSRLSEMLKKSGAPFQFLPSKCIQPFSIIEFEQQFNWVILELARQFHVKQVDWPGRGDDTALYELSTTPDVVELSCER